MTVDRNCEESSRLVCICNFRRVSLVTSTVSRCFLAWDYVKRPSVGGILSQTLIQWERYLVDQSSEFSSAKSTENHFRDEKFASVILFFREVRNDINNMLYENNYLRPPPLIDNDPKYVQSWRWRRETTNRGVSVWNERRKGRFSSLKNISSGTILKTTMWCVWRNHT